VGPQWGRHAFLASGFGGQLVVVIPAKRLVAVEVVDLSVRAKGIRTQSFLDLVSRIVDLVP
jgi:CubicO group peptidase (beta-lactamase class C family)